MPAIFGGWLVGFLLIAFGSSVSNPVQRLWLRSLALPLDLAGYERVMGTPRFPSGRLVVTARFQQAPAPEEQRRLADAVNGDVARQLLLARRRLSQQREATRLVQGAHDGPCGGSTHAIRSRA